MQDEAARKEFLVELRARFRPNCIVSCLMDAIFVINERKGFSWLFVNVAMLEEIVFAKVIALLYSCGP
jgi:hypothetical protein